MSRTFTSDAWLAKKDFSLSVQFIDNIGQVTFIEQHFPIERMKIGSPLAIWREVFVINLEQIDFTLLYKWMYVVNGHIAEWDFIALLLHFPIETTQILIRICIRKVKSKLTPVFMFIDRRLEKVNQCMTIMNIERRTFLVSFISIICHQLLTWCKFINSWFWKKDFRKHFISTRK